MFALLMVDDVRKGSISRHLRYAYVTPESMGYLIIC